MTTVLQFLLQLRLRVVVQTAALLINLLLRKINSEYSKKFTDLQFQLFHLELNYPIDAGNRVTRTLLRGFNHHCFSDSIGVKDFPCLK